jgi:predicted phage tail protein
MNNKEQMRPLNTTDGWEEQINANAIQRASARERIANKKRERKFRKMKQASTVTAAACIVFVILGAAGAVAGWLTTVLAVVSLMASSFLFGRCVEVKKG